jgi:hypothetical protein
MGDNDGLTQGAAPSPGPNPLFFGVLVAVAVGVLVGSAAGDGRVLESHALFRIVVGGAAFVVAYLVVAALWLGWQRRLFKRVHVAAGGVDMSDDDAVRREVTARDREISEFMGHTTKAMEELDRRVTNLEDDEGR